MATSAQTSPIEDVYWRRNAKLSRNDLLQLEQYMAFLRDFYGIPEGQPVFPKFKPQKPAKTAKPSRTARNGAHHPWRSS